MDSPAFALMRFLIGKRPKPEELILVATSFGALRTSRQLRGSQNRRLLVGAL